MEGYIRGSVQVWQLRLCCLRRSRYQLCVMCCADEIAPRESVIMLCMPCDPRLFKPDFRAVSKSQAERSPVKRPSATQAARIVHTNASAPESISELRPSSCAAAKSNSSLTRFDGVPIRRSPLGAQAAHATPSADDFKNLTSTESQPCFSPGDSICSPRGCIVCAVRSFIITGWQPLA